MDLKSNLLLFATVERWFVKVPNLNLNVEVSLSWDFKDDITLFFCLLAYILQFSAERGSSIDSILHELLQKGDSAQKYMQGSRSMKIDNWILLDNYVQGCGASSSSYTRALQIHSKRSRKHMSIKQHKKHGSLELLQEFHG